MRTVVVIPAHNEERTVGDVVQRVREIVPHVLVIDDGSTDATGDRARAAGAVMVRHTVNRGLGAALGTGFAAVLSVSFRGAAEESRSIERPDIIVTMDADGQHDPADIPALIAPIVRGEADMVIGTRFRLSPSSGGGVGGGALSERGAPLSRIAANRTANLVTRALFSVQCSDTQSGFRALSRHAVEQLDLRTNRMEVSSEIIAEAARLHLRIAEVPIRIIYTEYSLSKGQSPIVGLRTAWGLVMRRWY